MSEEYLSLFRLVVDGRELDDFKDFEDDTIEPRKRVDLANKSGYCAKTKRYGFKASYVIPAIGAFDFEAVKNATAIVEWESGVVWTYSGVTVLSIGAAKADGENEVTREITFMATGRREE